MTDPTRIVSTVLVGGVNVSSYMNFNTNPPRFENVLTNQVDSMDVVLFGADSVDLTELQDVTLMNGSEILFSGPLLHVNVSRGASGAQNKYTLTVGDYSVDLNGVEVKKWYKGYTDAAIIADMVVESGYTGFDATTYVASLKTHEEFLVNGETLAEVLPRLCELSGGDWYVDYEKNIHYFSIDEFYAPYNISDVPGEAGCQTCEELEVDRDATGIANKIRLIGGTYLSPDKDEYVTGNGVSLSAQLPYRMAAPTTDDQIIVKRNDGGYVVNLVANPSYENNITDGWTQYEAGTGGVWAQDATKFHKGTKCLKITAGTGITGVRGATIAVAPGDYLTAQVRAWCPAGVSSLSIYNVSASAKLIEQFSRKTYEWELLTVTWWNDSAASVNVRMDLINNATDGETVVYFDAAQAEKQSWPSDYADGSLGAGYSWSGTAHNSSSTRVNMPIWTTLTVKTGDNQELDSRFECSYFDKDGRLEQEANWPKLDKGIWVFGRRSLAIEVLGTSEASHTFYGKWRWKTITDESIVDLGVAKERIKAELAKYAFKTQVVKFKVREPGLRSGQTIHVKNSLKGLDDDLLIQRVVTTPNRVGFIVAEVEAGVYDRTFVDAMLAIKRAQVSVEWREDSVILIVIDINEELPLVEETSVTATQGPYIVGPDLIWGFFTYNE